MAGSGAENILGTEQPLQDFLPIKKEVMGWSESWSKMAPSSLFQGPCH